MMQVRLIQTVSFLQKFQPREIEEIEILSKTHPIHLQVNSSVIISISCIYRGQRYNLLRNFKADILNPHFKYGNFSYISQNCSSVKILC